MNGLVVEPCVIGDGFTASYWSNGVCLTDANENFDVCPLVAASMALELALKAGQA